LANFDKIGSVMLLYRQDPATNRRAIIRQITQAARHGPSAGVKRMGLSNKRTVPAE
jgi:hypothetical protein